MTQTEVNRVVYRATGKGSERNLAEIASENNSRFDRDVLPKVTGVDTQCCGIKSPQTSKSSPHSGARRKRRSPAPHRLHQSAQVRSPS